MLNRKIIQHLLLITIFFVITFWLIQLTYNSSSNDKLSARQKLKENIDIEIQDMKFRKNNDLTMPDVEMEEKPVNLNTFKVVKENDNFKTDGFPKIKKAKRKKSEVSFTSTTMVTSTNPILQLHSEPRSLKKFTVVKEHDNFKTDIFSKIKQGNDKKSAVMFSTSTTVVTSINPIKQLQSVSEAEDLYYKTITTDTITCSESKRFGRSDDGGWDVCLVKNLKIEVGKCMIYSFGVNYIWEFDDQLSTDYQCTVRTFDPSMTNEPDEYQRSSKVWFYKIGLGNSNSIWKNGWKIMTLSSLMRKFNEENGVIDILKIDIEYSEWDSFTSILQDGIFKNVKQLLFETHTEEVQGRSTSLTNYVRFLTIWNDLYKLGFRQWKHHWNHFGNYDSRWGPKRTCCYEHYLINTNFL